MPIFTVLGPIEPQELGPTSMHEHIFIDARTWLGPPLEELPDASSVCLESLGFLRWNPLSLPDNLVLDDPSVALDELRRFRAAGGQGLVDLTVVGLGPRLEELPALARGSGLHVMVGAGFYVNSTHPRWVERASVDELTQHLIGELTYGVAGTAIKPALLGELGTSHPVTERERKVVRAAAAAARVTGAAVNVHLDPRGAHALEILDLIASEQVAPQRVIFSHLDEHLDVDYHRAVAQAGAVLEFDTWGTEVFFAALGFRDPSDLERVEHAARLLEEGFAEQLVLGCDVWMKTCLRRYGGMGYEHLPKRVLALLERSGVDRATLRTIMVKTPRRLLDRPWVGSVETGSSPADQASSQQPST